jgi:50S ribosomal protein L16 3-hydroxylase
MFADWLAPTTIESFMSSHLHRNAWAQPATHAPQLDWDVLAHVLGQNEAKPDVIVCARGHMLAYPAPRDLDAMRAYLRMGIGLCLRHTQDCHPMLTAIAESFRARFAGRVQVQLFVTPSGTHGFGWHYDAEHVFISQSVGVKDYFFRENTTEKDSPFPPHDFSGFRRETSQMQTATLVPGDFLYIPARWWHMAVAREDSLSISVGVMPD